MPEQPPEKPTTQLPAVPAWAIELTRSVKEGFAKVDANLGLLSSDLEVVKGRVGNLEEARRVSELRAANNSMRAKLPSEHDLETKAALVNEVGAREALAVKVDSLLEKTDLQTEFLRGAAKLSKDPRVIGAVVALLYFLKSWLEKHT